MKTLLTIVALLCFAGYAHAQCTNAGIVDFSGGTAGSAATAANLSASGHGIPGNWNYSVSSNQTTNGGITFSTSAHGKLALNHPFCNPYAFYTDASTLGLKYDSGSGGIEYVLFNYPTNQGTLVHATTGGWFSTNLPQTSGVNIDMGPTTQGAAGGFNNVILSSNGTSLGLTCEDNPQPGASCGSLLKDGSGSSISLVPIPSDLTKRFWITMEFFRSAGSGHYAGRVYQESASVPGTVGALIGQWDFDPGAGASAPLYTYWGDAINNAKPSGFEYRLDHFNECFATARTCPYPLLPDSYIPPWSTVLDPARATDWTQAGFPGATLPDAAWTQKGSTLAAGSYSGATINASMSGCSNQFYLLGPGTFTITGQINVPANCVLRGSGSNTTFLVPSGSGTGCADTSALVCLKSSDGTFTNQTGGPSNTCSWTAGYAQGATQVTLSNLAGTCLSAISTTNPTLLFMDQCDTGYSGSGNCTGSAVDNGQLFICADHFQAGPTGCSSSNPDSGGSRGNGGTFYHRDQIEVHTATAVAGGTVTITPPLIMPNWASGQTPEVWIVQPLVNAGVENLAIDGGNSSSVALAGVGFQSCYHCWVSGVKLSNLDARGIGALQLANTVIQNNYVYHTQGNAPGAYGMRCSACFNNIFQNNIDQQSYQAIFLDGSTSGNVFGYNFSDQVLNVGQSFMNDAFVEHAANYYDLWEGNVGNMQDEDGAHGTGSMITRYRNFFTGWESYPSNPKNSDTIAVNDQSYDRYENSVANVTGTAGYHTGYLSTSPSNSVSFLEGAGNGSASPAVPTDALTKTTTLFWGNYDVFSAANRWCGNSSDTGWVATCGSASETPTAASTYPNAVPVLGDTGIGQASLPASFYLSAKPSWFGSIPWPAIGPDISSGSVGQCSGTINTVGQFAKVAALQNSQCTGTSLVAGWAGHVNANPAMTCALNTMGMPPDGSGSVLAFDANTCAGGAPPPPSQPAPATQFAAMPLPAQPPIPALTLSTPTQSYVTASGFSQDGKTWNKSLTLMLTGTGFTSTTACTFNGTSVPCVCGSATSCIATVPASLVPVPTKATQYPLTLSNPAVPVLVLQ